MVLVLRLDHRFGTGLVICERFEVRAADLESVSTRLLRVPLKKVQQYWEVATLLQFIDFEIYVL